MRALKLRIAVEKLRLSAPFRISGFVFEEQEVVVVTLDDGTHSGRGEASGVYYLGDTAQAMMAAIEAVRSAIEAGVDRAALQGLAAARRRPQCGGLRAVGARCAAPAHAGVEAGRTAAAEAAGHDIHARRR